MSPEINRNLGEQPIAHVIRDHGLKPHDLVASSTEQITHKMVSRACKGRRLTPNVQLKVLAALNRAAAKTYSIRGLFNYWRSPRPDRQFGVYGRPDAQTLRD